MENNETKCPYCGSANVEFMGQNDMYGEMQWHCHECDNWFNKIEHEKIIVVFYLTEETEIWYITALSNYGARVLDLKLSAHWYDNEWNFLLDNQQTGELVVAESAGVETDVIFDEEEIRRFIARQIGVYFPQYEILNIERI